MSEVTPAPFISVYADMLQMAASLSALDQGLTPAAQELAAALTADRQALALSNIARILVTLVETSSEVSKRQVYFALRQSVIEKISKAE